MDNNDLIYKYNYDTFEPKKFGPWMQFDQSPPVGVSAPDFPLWDLAENQILLSEVWSKYAYTVVEFGSFT